MTTETPDALTSALRKLVKRGNMTHLSVICSDGIFKAAYRGVEGGDHRQAESPDIVDALMQALTGRRAKLEKPEKPIKPAAVKKSEPYEDLL